MQKKKATSKQHRLQLRDLIVDVDWGSSGIWICTKDGIPNDHYSNHDLPEWLAYGRSLAVDLKRVLGKKQRVFFWFHCVPKAARAFESFEEIVLPDEEKVRLSIPPG